MKLFENLIGPSRRRVQRGQNPVTTGASNAMYAISTYIGNVAEAAASIGDLMRGKEPHEEGYVDEGVRQTVSTDEQRIDDSTKSVERKHHLDPLIPTETEDCDELVSFQEALGKGFRLLNSPDRLANSKLAMLLPNLIRMTLWKTQGSRVGDPTDVERYSALRSLIQDSIESLRPENFETNPTSRAAECYTALKEQYLEGRPASQIASRLCLAERTFFHRRRAGLKIIAADLYMRELREGGHG